MKVAVVVGSAPCLHEDLKRALELYPFAFICAVNGACVEIEELDAIKIEPEPVDGLHLQRCVDAAVVAVLDPVAELIVEDCNVR